MYFTDGNSVVNRTTIGKVETKLSTLFTKVDYAHILEGQIPKGTEETEETVNVYSEAIQSDGFDQAEQAFKLFAAQNNKTRKSFIKKIRNRYEKVRK